MVEETKGVDQVLMIGGNVLEYPAPYLLDDKIVVGRRFLPRVILKSAPPIVSQKVDRVYEVLKSTESLVVVVVTAATGHILGEKQHDWLPQRGRWQGTMQARGDDGRRTGVPPHKVESPRVACDAIKLFSAAMVPESGGGVA